MRILKKFHTGSKIKKPRKYTDFTPRYPTKTTNIKKRCGFFRIQFKNYNIYWILNRIGENFFFLNPAQWVSSFFFVKYLSFIQYNMLLLLKKYLSTQILNIAWKSIRCSGVQYMFFGPQKFWSLDKMVKRSSFIKQQIPHIIRRKGSWVCSSRVFCSQS